MNTSTQSKPIGMPRKDSDKSSASTRGVPFSMSMSSAVWQLAALLLGGLIAIFLAGDSPAQITVTLTLIYIAYASAWNIVAGFAGQFTFGHSAFFGLGAYSATLLTQWIGLPPMYGLWVGVLAAAIAATVIGIITLRLRGLYFGLATVVFPTVFAVFATYLGFQEVSVPFSPDGGLESFTPGDPKVLSFVALAAALLVCIVAVALLRSRFGTALGALRSDQDAAEASGVNTTRVKIYALVLSAALSAIAGGLYASVSLVVTPVDVFGLQMSVKPVLMTVFGGIGTLAGPVLGAAILVPLSETLNATFGATLPSLSGLVYGAALLLVITLFPGGLVPFILSVAKRVYRSGAPSAAAEVAAGVSSRSDATEQVKGGTEEDASHWMPSQGRDTPVEPGAPILTIAQIAKAFGGTKVLHDVTMQVASREIVGIIGPNGAGKTTLFNIISGFVKPDAGSMQLHGTKTNDLRPSAIAALGLGRTFQTVRLFSGMTAIENVLVGALASCADREAASRVAWSAIEEVGLAGRALRKVDGLTTGELRRLELARAMAIAGQGGLLLLDEFLGGLTKEDSAALLEALIRWRKNGGSVLAIEHTMRAMADFVDRFVVLNFGKVIAQGSPEEILKNQDVIKAYLGDKWGA